MARDEEIRYFVRDRADELQGSRSLVGHRSTGFQGYAGLAGCGPRFHIRIELNMSLKSGEQRAQGGHCRE